MTTAACIIAYLAASFALACVLGRMMRGPDDDTDARDVMLTGDACDHGEPGSGR